MKCSLLKTKLLIAHEVTETFSRKGFISLIQSDLYYAATLGTLKSGLLIEVSRLTEVQYKLYRKGTKHAFIAFIQQNALKSERIGRYKSKIYCNLSAFPAHAQF